jgi:hypothetical protein
LRSRPCAGCRNSNSRRATPSSRTASLRQRTLCECASRKNCIGLASFRSTGSR